MKLLYIFVFILSFQSCSRDPCAENYPIETFKTVGNIDLIDSTKAWIESIDTVLNFQNKMGNIVNMTVYSSTFGTSNKDISTISIPSTCSNTTLTYQYSIPVEQREFQIPQLRFTLILSREKSEYSNYVYDSNDVPIQRSVKMGDELKVQMYFGYIGYYGDLSYYYPTNLTILPKDNWNLARRIVYDTLTVGGKLFHNVYYCYRDTSDMSNMKSFDLSIYPMGVYYGFNNGILGFTLLNGDYWFRK
jgi:hypothetical protein